MDLTLDELDAAIQLAGEAGDDEAVLELNSQVERIMNQPKSAQDVAGEYQSWWDKVTEPNRPEFDVAESAKRFGISTAVGAGIGALSPDPLTTVAGGLAGASGAVAEELGRAMGVSDFTRTAMGVVGSLGIEAIPVVYKYLGTRLTAKAPGVPARVGVGGGEGSILSNRVESSALDSIRQKLFGKASFELGVTPKNMVDTQAKLSQQFFGMPNVSEESVSTLLRKKFYDTLKDAKESTVKKTIEVAPAKFDAFGRQIAPSQTKQVIESNAFINSPEFKSLLKDLQIQAKTPKRAPKGARKDLIKILQNELDPKVTDSSKSVLNLIQNGGEYIGSTGETQKLITESMQNALKKRFDEYLERTVGAKQYEQLKYAERQEFIAQAKDYIPRLLEGGWRSGNEKYKMVMDTVKNSPETKAEYIKALYQHIGSLKTPEAALGEFRRLANGLVDGKIITEAEKNALYKKVTSFEKDLPRAKILEQVKSSIGLSLTELLSTQSANFLVPDLPKEDYLNPNNNEMVFAL